MQYLGRVMRDNDPDRALYDAAWLDLSRPNLLIKLL